MAGMGLPAKKKGKMKNIKKFVAQPIVNKKSEIWYKHCPIY